MISDSTARALLLIRNHKIDSPRQFARFMWPDSDGWKRHSKAGPNGVSRGGGMNLAAGGYLGKLERRRLIRRSITVVLPYRLTEEGSAALDEWKKARSDRLLFETVGRP